MDAETEPRIRAALTQPEDRQCDTDSYFLRN
jgi:hypothetical protein